MSTRAYNEIQFLISVLILSTMPGLFSWIKIFQKEKKICLRNSYLEVRGCFALSGEQNDMECLQFKQQQKKKTMKKDRKTVSYMIYNIQADRYLTRVDRWQFWRPQLQLLRHKHIFQSQISVQPRFPSVEFRLTPKWPLFCDHCKPTRRWKLFVVKYLIYITL